jgi:hypothetical protein
MNTELNSLLLSCLLLLAGVTLVHRAASSARLIVRTLGPKYVETEMTIRDVNLVPNNLTGEAHVGALSDRTAMVLVRYAYSIGEVTFQSRGVFPLEVEWMKPRIPPLTLFEDLKAQRIRRCFVDAHHPERAVLFLGWTPYLRSHVAGVATAGFLTTAAGVFFLVVTVRG